ncbi:unnamed protein product [Caenorhabditis auriculariae]|uniref:Protein kinase domain-containing protein n=1 Tax=Caenorhabditis auriculariae TaxID=2777116 RepID=A0A8S1H410_9PELO|nr:unnamed protein product [Caenorhabditis auriculariae]
MADVEGLTEKIHEELKSLRLEKSEVPQGDIGPAMPQKEETKKMLKPNDLPYEIINGIPCYQSGHVLDGHVEIYERVGFDDRVGATYLGIGADGKELVIRVGPDASTHVVRMEAAFLCKAEAENLWRFFSQVHQIWQSEDAYHMTLYFRGGPTLEDCLNFCHGKFSYGTGGRFGLDILQIMRTTHSLGYLMRSVNPGSFHLDASSRHLFMADISTLLKNVNEEGVAPYVGSLDFAPEAHHKGEGLTRRQELESWFYLFIYMLKGTLPWQALPYDQVAGSKLMTSCNQLLFSDLPPQFARMYEIIKEKNSFQPVSDEEYDQLEVLATEVYTIAGGITDHDKNFDFEREPTAEELPRLFLVRNDEKTKALDRTQEDSNEKDVILLD